MMQQALNESGFTGRIHIRAYNRTGGTLVAGDVVIPDWDNDSGDVSGTRADGPTGPTANLTSISNGTLVAKSEFALVCLSSSVADDAIGTFCLYGECDAFIGTSAALTALARGAMVGLNGTSMDKCFDAVGGTAITAKAKLMEATSAFAGTGYSNAQKKRIFLLNGSWGGTA